ncbi:late embryogenesis abundant protein ECP63-like isoform X2 [Camellia sinensis]|uniref:late embryogenesis abundant protein ECP63-like isoform X2 n=1 Tax=Camellia sinensis TaxID=4442 RepID=UPI001035AF22|nr:late embryogenesis abundant protein ECP63-like isoform X2 [Camellia sinensis]
MSMASRQDKVDRAEEAARVAVSELSDANTEKRTEEEEAAKIEEYEREEHRPSVVESLLKSVAGTLEQAKEAVTGKTQETAANEKREGVEAASEKARQTEKKSRWGTDSMAEKAKEAKDRTAERAGEYKEYAEETKNYSGEKAREYKDGAVEKTEETKECAAEKATEGKETAVAKMAELKDTAVDTARRAMGYLTGKKEETKEKAAETGEAAKEKYNETQDKPRPKMEEMKLSEESHEENRGTAGSGNIFSALGSVKDAIKEKLTVPIDTVEEKRVESEQGGGGGGGRGGEEAEKVVMVDMKETPAGEAASKLKATDQMSSQTFDDEGKGIAVVRLERKK